MQSRKRSVSAIFKWQTFHANSYTLKLPSDFIPESPQNTPLEASTSSYQSRVSKKLQLSRQSSSGGTTENLPSLLSSGQCDQSSYILIETSILNELVNRTSSCPEYDARGISIENNWLPCYLKLSCNNCNWSPSLYSSKEIEKKDIPGWNPFDVNIRIIIPFCEMGQGHSGLETFCAVELSMNMPPPMNVKAFNNMHGTIIRTGITCKNISCYMRNSACRWFIVENVKIFRSFVKHFLIFPREGNCRILIGLWKWIFMNHPIMFLDRDNKTKLVPVSFSYSLELLWEKNIF